MSQILPITITANNAGQVLDLVAAFPSQAHLIYGLSVALPQAASTPVEVWSTNPATSSAGLLATLLPGDDAKVNVEPAGCQQASAQNVLWFKSVDSGETAVVHVHASSSPYNSLG
jgi:hypothetical protein